MSAIDDLVPLLKKLRLSGVLQSLEIRMKQAVDDELRYDEFLFRLLADEVERRDAKQLEQRLRRASFENNKTLEDFDFHFNPEIPKTKIIDLGNCSFVDRKESVLLLGQAGVGKSHIAQALGHRACRAGYGVLYTAAGDMLRGLRAARGDDTYDRKLLRLTSIELLIIDDLGLRPLSGDEPHDLYEIIRLRYQRGATIVTANRDVEELAPLFGDPLLASAAMDRLLHGAHVLRMVGESHRNPPPKRRRRKTPGNGDAAAVSA